ncbi:DEAD/DEAH box helicase [Rhodoligotrophos appendicifer]|uniref:DEAD/DEAH box helicase n=1 Tax=Rhodoligotrophos appendicifer TaxID=987056 RepID=UPI001961B52A|nr:DEAD/DEAH box helicase [Rhodoligotrophos appendicifer]
MTFSELGLPDSILKTLEQQGYTNPTPIQAQAIPFLMAGRDLLGIAATGTGKTAAFALPILAKLNAEKRPLANRSAQVLVLSPTRELAQQIADSFKVYGESLRVKVAVVVGGASFRQQATLLQRGVDVLVATPGRLLDHAEQGTLRLDACRFFVLDEADHMLDLGFLPAVRKIIRNLPKQRQSLFFSATMPKEIAGLAAELLDQPERVSVTPESTPAERIDQEIIHVATAQKTKILTDILQSRLQDRVLVFTRTKRGADRVVLSLDKAGLNSAAIHGNKSQPQRQRALAGFKSGETSILVATDIAARGIDVDGIDLVVQYDLPEVPETYVHRIGRTGRAGASGQAVAFCASDEQPLLRAIEKVTRLTIPARRDPSADQEQSSIPASRPATRGKVQRTRPQAFGSHKPGNNHSGGAPRPQNRSVRAQSGQGGRPMSPARTYGS